MIWKEVEKEYGKKIANKLKKSPWLKGITVTITKNGEIDYPESDINRALLHYKNPKIKIYNWD